MADVHSFLKAVGAIAWIDATVTEREAKIVKAYYGLGEERKPIVLIAQEFDVTDKRIRQLKDRAIRKLRNKASGKASRRMRSFVD